jgi:hypothetical protein
MLQERNFKGIKIVRNALQDKLVHLEDTQTLGLQEQKGNV